MPESIPENISSRLDDIEKLVQGSVQRMRSIMAEYRPPMLDSYGLIPALKWYGEQFSRRANISVDIDDHYFKDIRLPAEIEIALFRIAQEALTNVAKHAQASQVEIELLENNDNILMTVTDNGVGFATHGQGISSEGHWGLTNMQERARAINGKFLLRSVPGQGTQILVKVGKDS
jgi:two-component system sensor histidine kinase UhpB